MQIWEKQTITVVVFKGWLFPRGGCFQGMVVSEGWLFSRDGCFQGMVVSRGSYRNCHRCVSTINLVNGTRNK